MTGHLLFIIFTCLLAAISIGAQAPTPTPTPVVTAPENLQGVPQIAPNYKSEDRGLPELGRVGVDAADQRPLTLKDAVELAFENNKDVEITRENKRIAEFDLKAARGVYEPRFAGQTYFERNKTPVFSFFQGGPNFSLTTSNFVANGGLQGLVQQTGASYNVTFNNNRNTTNNIFTSVNPTYLSSMVYSFTQPIFRGRSFDQNRRTIEISKRNLSLTNAQFRQRTLDIIDGVQRAYWDLTYSLRNLQVQRDSLRDAKAQLEHNRRLVDEGQLAPIDVVAAETQVATYEQAVYDALNVVNQSENGLKNLVSPNRANAIWSQSITPVDSVEVATPTISLTEAMDAAIQNRPELDTNRFQKEINAVDQRFYREQKKPQIDFFATFTQTGGAGLPNPNFVNPVGGSSTPTINQAIANLNAITQQSYPNLPQITPLTVTTTPSLPSYLVGGYGAAVSNVFANRYPSFHAGVQFNLPIFGDKTARAQYGRSLVEGERIDTQREQIEQNIQVEVRNSLQAVRTAEARLRAAAIARENSEKQYASEQRKLDEGQSDVYRVLDRQTALSAARSNELRARTELNKAIADLQHVTGNSLKDSGIETKE